MTHRLLVAQESVPDALNQALGPLGWVIGFLLVTIGTGCGFAIRYLVGELRRKDDLITALRTDIATLHAQRVTERAETLTTLQHVVAAVDAVTQQGRDHRGALSEHDRDVKARLDTVRDEVIDLRERLRPTG